MARGANKISGNPSGPGTTPPLDQNNRTVFLLEPVDAWFFRDGRPFDADDPAQMSVPSLFPPMPQTAIGAVRAALAMAFGWDGHSDWGSTPNNDLRQAVGNGDASLGALNNASVFLARFTETAPPANQPKARATITVTPLFDAPPALFGVLPQEGNALPDRIVRLKPGPLRRCDLDENTVRLPVFGDDTDRENCKPLSGKYWLTTAGMAAFLGGGVPDKKPEHLVASSSIAQDETRTGLAIDRTKRTAEPGKLYRVTYKRPQRRIGILVNAAAVTQRVRETAFPRPTPFGGEGRIAWISVQGATAPMLPAALGNLAPDQKSRVLRYTVTLMTPADLGDSWPKTRLPGLPGTIISACIDKPSQVSGWRRRGPIQEARRSHAIIPAGSTWFMEASANDLGAIRKAHGAAIGDPERTRWGYGRILIGSWKE